MDTYSPDDYEPPPDRIPDRAPERGSTTTRSSAPPAPGIRQSSASETAGRSTNSAGPPTPGTTPADQPAPRRLARRNHPVVPESATAVSTARPAEANAKIAPLCAVTSADTQQPGIVHIGGTARGRYQGAGHALRRAAGRRSARRRQPGPGGGPATGDAGAAPRQLAAVSFGTRACLHHLHVVQVNSA
jgi:hypothetical protein